MTINFKHTIIEKIIDFLSNLYCFINYISYDDIYFKKDNNKQYYDHSKIQAKQIKTFSAIQLPLDGILEQLDCSKDVLPLVVYAAGVL